MSDEIDQLVDWQLSGKKPDQTRHICWNCRHTWISETNLKCPSCREPLL
jgi:rubrerythrin